MWYNLYFTLQFLYVIIILSFDLKYIILYYTLLLLCIMMLGLVYNTYNWEDNEHFELFDTKNEVLNEISVFIDRSVRYILYINIYTNIQHHFKLIICIYVSIYLYIVVIMVDKGPVCCCLVEMVQGDV